MPSIWKKPGRVGAVAFKPDENDELDPNYLGQTFIDWDEIQLAGMANSVTAIMGIVGHEEVHQTGEAYFESGWNDYNTNPSDCVMNPHPGTL